MCVAALGSGFAANTSDMRTVSYTSSGNGIAATIVLTDGEGNPTSTMCDFEAEDTDIEVNVTGSSKVFDGVTVADDGEAVSDGVIYVTTDNADVSFSINGVSGKDGKVFFSTRVTEGSSSQLVIYLDESGYNALSSLGSLYGTVDMSSTLEVERVGFKYFTIIVGVLFVVFISITCLVIKEKSSVDMKTVSVGEMFKALVQNDQAMTIVLTIVLVNTATYITSNLLIYFFKYDLAGTNWQGNYTLFNTFAGGIQIIAMMIFFPVLRKIFNTLKIFYISVFSAIGGYVILLAMALAGVKSVIPFFVPGFFIMAAVGILNVIVTIFLANTVDYGELKNRRRDESVIFSMQTFVVKLASGIAALVASVCLALFNIQADSDTALSPSMLSDKMRAIRSGAETALGSSSVVGLRLVMTLAPIFVLIAALLLFKAKYILTDSKLNEITSELKGRRDNA
ncbi:MAG: MFS transporter [Clostridiales bacterium]|nr:MFS transporter [Clostridiales bacterium]